MNSSFVGGWGVVKDTVFINYTMAPPVGQLIKSSDCSKLREVSKQGSDCCFTRRTLHREDVKLFLKINT